MTSQGTKARAFLLLDVDREIVVGVDDGSPALIPPVVDDPLGVGLLDFVHPVDRAAQAEWLGAGLGASPPFRRAAADDPPRWFRFVAATPSPGGLRCRVLMVEVTDEVREDSLRQRLNSTLARHVGWTLVERSAAVAAELAGCTNALLAELHPPLAIIRSIHGQGMLPVGSTVPIAESPLEEGLSALTIREYENGVQEVFPEWALFEATRAESAVIVPVAEPTEATSRAVLLCFSPLPRRLLPLEAELLELLAVRLAAEFVAARQEETEEPDGEERGPATSEQLARIVTLAMGLRGITHTLNNLFAAQVLNAQLAAKKSAGDGGLDLYLERISEAARRGAGIMSQVALLGDERPAEVGAVNLVEIVRQGIGLVSHLHEAIDIELEYKDETIRVWGDERTVLGLLVAVLLPAAEIVEPGASLHVTAYECDERSGEPGTVALGISVGPLPPRSGEGEAGMSNEQRRMLELGVALSAQVAERLGGRLAMHWRGQQLSVDVRLPAFEA
ncbi:MAG: hypothetical protein LJE95_05560 [Acidobacteria bacterium]|nr:hypothetical protein [Acidobacteriota bacterium]